MEGKDDLAAIANELQTDVRKATNITFNSMQIPGTGMEPKIIGAATSLAAEQLSEPLVGNSGVFVLKVTSVTPGSDEDLQGERQRLVQNQSFRAASQAYEAHRELADIDDLRAKFY